MTDQSLWTYFLDASLVVKLVMLMLLAASIISWTFIFQCGLALKQARKAINNFEKQFWSGIELTKLYNQLSTLGATNEGLAAIFQAGFQEFMRLYKKIENTSELITDSVQRAMRIARSHEIDKLERHLPFLATIGSISPYIGLFGTVWGIMTSFHALSALKQTATLSMVAPGISEALIATAMGLFTAIPAVIFYNRYVAETERVLNHYEIFQEEFSNLLYRQTHMSVSVDD